MVESTGAEGQQESTIEEKRYAILRLGEHAKSQGLVRTNVLIVNVK
jgi:hypothetical protein